MRLACIHPSQNPFGLVIVPCAMIVTEPTDAGPVPLATAGLSEHVTGSKVSLATFENGKSAIRISTYRVPELILAKILIVCVVVPTEISGCEAKCVAVAVISSVSRAHVLVPPIGSVQVAPVANIARVGVQLLVIPSPPDS